MKRVALFPITLLCFSLQAMFILESPAPQASLTSDCHVYSPAPLVEWNKTYGTKYWEDAYSGVQTSDGGYAIAGTILYQDGYSKFLLVKTDAYGNQQWNKTYGLPYEPYGYTEEDWAFSLVQTTDGGYAIAGVRLRYGIGPGDFWLVKTDATGNMQWNKTYGGTGDDWAYSVIQTTDGGYAIVGYTTSFGAGGEDMWLVKTDAYGNVDWNKTYGGTSDEKAYSVIQTVDGGYTLAGRALGFCLVKTDALGNTEWNKTYGSGTASSVIQTNDEGYGLAGYTSDGYGLTDVWLVKTDFTGNIEWNKTCGGKYWDLGSDVIQTVDGGYAIAGFTMSFGAGEYDFWLVKTDASGNILWNETYGGAQDDYAFFVVQTMDGGLAIAGTTESFGAGRSDFWLIKLAPTSPAITATVDIHPNALNLRNRGQSITAYIELQKNYNVNDINISTVTLNDTIPAEAKPIAIGDYDNDTIPDLMIKFDRAEVISYALANVDITELIEERFMTVTLAISGYLNEGTPFQGSDTIKIILPTPMYGRFRGMLPI